MSRGGPCGAKLLGEWDLAGELSGKFECPADLNEADHIRVESEEGWILGAP
jgi:hypothetical protein